MTPASLRSPKSFTLVAMVLCLALGGCTSRRSGDPFSSVMQPTDIAILVDNHSQRAVNLYLVRNAHPFLLGRVEALQAERFPVGHLIRSAHDRFHLMAVPLRSGVEAWSSQGLAVRSGERIVVTLNDYMALSQVDVRQE